MSAPRRRRAAATADELSDELAYQPPPGGANVRAAPAHRRTNVRSAPVAVPSLAPLPAYRRTRAGIAVALLMLLMLLLWLANGDFTATFVMETWNTSATIGWSVHLLFSTIELAFVVLRPYLRGMPRWFVLLILLLPLPFGIFDVYSSAIGVAPYLLWTGATGQTIHAQNTLIAETIAFLPEPALFWLTVVLYRILKDRA